MHRDKTYTARELAKKSGLRNVQDFNNLLEDSKLQLKRHGTSVTLCKVCSFSGYASTGCEVLKSGYANYNTRWTQKAEHSYLIKLHS